MAHIEKLSAEDSNDHFENRSKEKNPLAISSDQSKKIHSYEEVIDNYNKVLNSDRLPMFSGQLVNAFPSPPQ